MNFSTLNQNSVSSYTFCCDICMANIKSKKSQLESLSFYDPMFYRILCSD